MIWVSLPEITIHFTDPWQRSLSPTITIRQLLSEWGLFSVQSVHCRDSLISEKKLKHTPPIMMIFPTKQKLPRQKHLLLVVLQPGAQRFQVSFDPLLHRV